ncbi:hypothetical protein GCM10007388_12780 [Pseudoduganella plicata]|uniref:Uncharacterized protein n=1 Tax=Pseudoduganella plicata TaxID=321984 RepID=A0AA88C7B8_9BURK|nr:hypothetical protein GCM10007388_12780 [Pseudoduganella plicata]
MADVFDRPAFRRLIHDPFGSGRAAVSMSKSSRELSGMDAGSGAIAGALSGMAGAGTDGAGTSGVTGFFLKKLNIVCGRWRGGHGAGITGYFTRAPASTLLYG